MAQKTTVTYVDDMTGEDIKDGKGGPQDRYAWQQDHQRPFCP